MNQDQQRLSGTAPVLAKGSCWEGSQRDLLGFSGLLSQGAPVIVLVSPHQSGLDQGAEM